MRLRSPWNLNTLLARGVLALVLLFAQHQAATHWVSHTAESKLAKHGGSSPAEHCDECLALGALGTAATATTPALPACGAQHALHALPVAERLPAAQELAYRSRAPPTLS
jgi:hypothetical protein